MASTEPFPPSADAAWPALRHVTKTGAHEWHSECPRCGEAGHAGGGRPDRFVVRDDGIDPVTGRARVRGWCRRCRYFAFADEPGRQITTEEILALRTQREAEREREEREVQHLVARYSADMLARALHARLGADQREWWEARGVPEYYQDFLHLGYTESRTFSHAGSPFVASAYTVPIFEPSPTATAPHLADDTWRVVNTQFRIIGPPPGVGKYRQEYGLPAAAFVARPDLGPVGEAGRVIVVEGPIKAAVVYIRGTHGEYQVWGLPGCQPGRELRKQLADRLQGADEVLVALDPDARQHAHELARDLGPRARVVTLPDKPDDFILGVARRDGNSRAAEVFERHLQYARVSG